MAHGNNPSYGNEEIHKYYFEEIVRISIFCQSEEIREYGSTLYVGLARAVSLTNTNFRLTFLLTRLQEALYEDLAV